VLPRLWWHAQGERGVLALAVRPSELRPRRVARLLGLLERALELVASSAPPPPAVEVAALLAPGGAAAPDDGEYLRRVAQIRDAIGRGEVEKVVAARCVELGLAAPPGAAAWAGRLAASPAAGFSFLLRHQGTIFLGASPERLVSRRGRAVASDALAGSRRAGGAGAAASLLASPKDRREHSLVVRHVVGRLRARCSHLEWPASPRPLGAGALLHLWTPVRGQLDAATHVLDLAASLHPTPAVGGAPGPAAARWIAREPHERGWYASPVGWFDRAGDGDLAVALRSAVAAGDRVHLWAGAGIVAGSEPEAELHETELKLRAMRRILGDGEAS
jgi:isochorismate synthase